MTTTVTSISVSVCQGTQLLQTVNQAASTICLVHLHLILLKHTEFHCNLYKNMVEVVCPCWLFSLKHLFYTANSVLFKRNEVECEVIHITVILQCHKETLK